MTKINYHDWVTQELVEESNRHYDESMKGVWERFFTWPEGTVVFNTLRRHQKRPQKGGENQPPGWFEISMLMREVEQWRLRWSLDNQLRPNERQSLIEDTAKLALQLRKNLAGLGVMWNVTQLVDENTLTSDAEAFLWACGIDHEDYEHENTDFESIGDAISKMGSDSFTESTIFNIYNLLALVGKQNWLQEQAQISRVSKIDAPTSERVFLIRCATEFFTASFGKKLEEPVASLVAIILNDVSIDRDAVRSALKGYEFDPGDWGTPEYRMNLLLRRQILSNP